jgi:hypothetical protein
MNARAFLLVFCKRIYAFHNTLLVTILTQKQQFILLIANSFYGNFNMFPPSSQITYVISEDFLQNTGDCDKILFSLNQKEEIN